MTNKLAVAGPNSKFQAPDAEPAGFWAGVWHGLIAPITLVVSFFNKGVRIYETHNTGVGYDIGFIMGVASSLGSNAAQHGPGSKDEDEDEIEEAVEDE